MLNDRFHLNQVSLAYLLLFASLSAFSQSLSQAEIMELSAQELPNSIDKFMRFLTIPNNGRNVDDIDKNLSWCKQEFEDLGFQTEELTSSGVPHLLATWLVNKKLPTVLFYLQIDGQPVTPSQWNQANPFEPVVKTFRGDRFETIQSTNFLNPNLDDRIFARSASDSKGPAMAFITALRIIKRERIKPGFNIKVLFDFQEELGSPTLPQLVTLNREKFLASAVLIMDGTRHVSNLPTLTFGARGIATISLKVFGPRYDLHSGQYGNYAPNPVFHMADLLASMKDEQGRVTIPGFYHGIEMDESIRKNLRIEQENEAELVKRIGIASPESVGSFYQEALQYPSLNVRGLQAGQVGAQATTTIPAEVVAEIDMRLVTETPAERQIELVRQHIVNQGYYIVDGEPTDEERAAYPKLASFTYRIGSKPFRTPLNSPLGEWLNSRMKFLYGNNFVRMQLTGGSQPIEPFISTLKIPAVSIRIPNPDNNIHAADENIRIGNYLQGIEMCLAILTQQYP